MQGLSDKYTTICTLTTTVCMALIHNLTANQSAFCVYANSNQLDYLFGCQGTIECLYCMTLTLTMTEQIDQ